MTKTRRWLTLFLLVIGSTLILAGGLSFAQDDEDEPEAAEYIGLRDCAGCHRDTFSTHRDTRHALALQDVASDKELILADFEQETDLLTIPFPDEGGERRLSPDDIVYAIGSGRYVQRYLYQVDSNEYQVLPVEWNTVTSEWQAYTRADAWPDPAYDWLSNCAGCHVSGLDTESGRWLDDGVQCESCHGPGSTHADAVDALRDIDEEEEPDAYLAQLQLIRSTVVVSADAQICGQCHSQGESPNDGFHYPTAYRPGQNLGDEGVFTLFTAESHPDLWWTAIHGSGNNMQYNEWLLSGHNSTPSLVFEGIEANTECLTCHSADYTMSVDLRASYENNEDRAEYPSEVWPTIIGADDAQFGITCISCHNAHPEDPSTDFFLDSDPYTLCTACHSDTNSSDGLHYPVTQMFEGQTVIDQVEGIPSAHFSAESGPDCASCHMPSVPVESFELSSHAFAPIQPGDALNFEALEDSCSTCHGEQAEPIAMQALIDDLQTGIANRVATAREAIDDDTPDWVILALDFVEGDGSGGVHNYVYTDRLLDEVESALGITGGAQEQ